MAFAMAAGFGMHRQAAGWAELRGFRFHARRDFYDVRDDIGAQPHGVGRTGLLGVGIGRNVGLGAGPIELIKQRASQQRQPANKAYRPHVDCPHLENLCRRAKVAAAQGAVDGGSTVVPRPGHLARLKVAKVRSSELRIWRMSGFDGPSMFAPGKASGRIADRLP